MKTIFSFKNINKTYLLLGLGLLTMSFVTTAVVVNTTKKNQLASANQSLISIKSDNTIPLPRPTIQQNPIQESTSLISSNTTATSSQNAESKTVEASHENKEQPKTEEPKTLEIKKEEPGMTMVFESPNKEPKTEPQPTPEQPNNPAVTQSAPAQPPVNEPKPEPQPEPASAQPTTNKNFYSYNCSTAWVSEMYNLVNQHRTNNGIAPLQYNANIGSVACAHSIWMNQTGNFDHTGRDGTDPFERCQKAGYSCNGENIAYNSQPSAYDLFQQFVDSPAHNANMLDSRFHSIGLGFDSGYVTQVFSI